MLGAAEERGPQSPAFILPQETDGGQNGYGEAGALADGQPHGQPTEPAPKSIRLKLAGSPLSSVDTLLPLASDPDFEVRLNVATNPRTPAAWVEILANGGCEAFRLRLARADLLPERVIHLLAIDCNQLVACRATLTVALNRLNESCRKRLFLSNLPVPTAVSQKYRSAS